MAGVAVPSQGPPPFLRPLKPPGDTGPSEIESRVCERSKFGDPDRRFQRIAGRGCVLSTHPLYSNCSVTVAASPGFANSASVAISIVFTLNLILFVFNLIPLPPLDGSGVVSLFLSDSAAERYAQLLHQPAFRIIGLVVAWRLIGVVLGPAHLLALNILYPGAGYH